VALFEVRFNPSLKGREAKLAALTAELEAALEVRHQPGGRPHHPPLLALIDGIACAPISTSAQTAQRSPICPSSSVRTCIPEMPLPVPYAEIFVTSMRMEGIHLRGGAVARGGLRWSDRPEDFRTEVLGLVKAQMVKNAVIVPQGAKGGFHFA
jgi:glutamate dehydrogenase